MKTPCSTYRLQFEPSFNFSSASKVLPYLNDLGAGAVYASPVFAARPGSTHGYDIIDHGSLNPELGTIQEFMDLTEEVLRRNMLWVQDIVPNHMAFDWRNSLLEDIFEEGSNSGYYQFFDINWDHQYDNLKERILAPFLGSFYSSCLEKGEIKLAYDAQGLCIRYYDQRYPLSFASYKQILLEHLDNLKTSLAEDSPMLIKFIGTVDLIDKLCRVDTPVPLGQFHHAKKMLHMIYQENEGVRAHIEGTIASYNGTLKNPENLTRLDNLILKQKYRLSFWKVASEEINYRRFFSVNDLICLKVENPRVHTYVHSLLLKLLKDKAVSGVRIDHLDGLYDPEQYLKRLRDDCPDTYIVAEKILESDEDLPARWPVQGTTGYDFMNMAAGVLCYRKNRLRILRAYGRFTGECLDYQQLMIDKKALIAEKHFMGTIDMLAFSLKNSLGDERYSRDVTLYGLRRALIALMVHFPVYRTYINSSTFTSADKEVLAKAVNAARETRPDLVHELNLLEYYFQLENAGGLKAENQEKLLQLIMYFQQQTGPLMAKGCEDTAFYVYYPLLALNEVGGNPGRFGYDLAEFHAWNKDRARNWPLALNATATHDTKRGEDTRMRLLALSEHPKEWEKLVNGWSRYNRDYKKIRRDTVMPSCNDEYMLYQTITGTYPLAGDHDNKYVERIKSYVLKAVKEAKVHTAWIKPDEEYENTCVEFVEKILDNKRKDLFLPELKTFSQKISFFGMLNSLTQCVLKMTCPGIPDFYQGTELWDYSLVDPDNRRPVDYTHRAEMLAAIQGMMVSDNTAERQILLQWKTGIPKMFLTHRVLKWRNQHAQFFEKATYQPLSCKGKYKNNVIAFARNENSQWAIVLAPRFYSKVVPSGKMPLGSDTWEDTYVVLPNGAPTNWVSVLDNRKVTFSGKAMVGTLLSAFPVEVLRSGEAV
ncbi:MAG: malto-oligosyltrehalose synthase [Fibrobacteria bacterium]|nr:malto-oligosyltrehalose synthase [Fibrobacteria bacterium]